MNSPHPLLSQALAAHQSGLLDKAKMLYLQALPHSPPTHQADIFNLLGTICTQQRQYPEALTYLTQALQRAPQQPVYLINLAEAQSQSGQDISAIDSLQQALAIQANHPIAHYNLANTYQKLKRWQEATPHYLQALRLNPQAHYYYNYGNNLLALGQWQAAQQAYQQALALNPHSAQAHNNLGVVYTQLKDYTAACQHYQQALRYAPQSAEVHRNLSQHYAEHNALPAARQHLTILKSLQPTAPVELAQAVLLPIIPESNSQIKSALAHFATACKALKGLRLKADDLLKYELAFPSVITYYGQQDRELREAYTQLIVESQAIPDQGSKRFSNPRPHLGFVVTQGHEGVFLRCMAGLLARLPQQYELTVVCGGAQARQRLARSLPNCRYLELPTELLAAAEALSAAAFDLLYYWEIGTDPLNYFLPFFRAAPVQCTSWGWPVTSGIPTLDAFLSATGLEPEGAASHYSERLYQSARLPVFYERQAMPEALSAAQLGFPPDSHLYFCPQNLRKIQPDMDVLFGRILKQDPRGHLVLIADQRPALTQCLQQRLQQHLLHIAPEAIPRVHFLPYLPEARFLEWIKSAHVILDTLHYSGGANTNYAAFQAGTPVITLTGSFHRGRYTTAAYGQMGESFCVTQDADDYVQKALMLAQDRHLRQEVSQRILSGSANLLEDPQAIPAFCEMLEQLLT